MRELSSLLTDVEEPTLTGLDSIGYTVLGRATGKTHRDFEGRDEFSERVLGIHAGAKEVLAHADLRHDVSLRRSRSSDPRERRCTVHLYRVLIEAISRPRGLSLKRPLYQPGLFLRSFETCLGRSPR